MHLALASDWGTLVKLFDGYCVQDNTRSMSLWCDIQNVAVWEIGCQTGDDGNKSLGANSVNSRSVCLRKLK